MPQLSDEELESKLEEALISLAWDVDANYVKKLKRGQSAAISALYQSYINEARHSILTLIHQQTTAATRALAITTLRELDSLPTYDRSLFRDGYTNNPADRRDMWEKEAVISVLQAQQKKGGE